MSKSGHGLRANATSGEKRRTLDVMTLKKNLWGLLLGQIPGRIDRSGGSKAGRAGGLEIVRRTRACRSLKVRLGTLIRASAVRCGNVRVIERAIGFDL